MLFCSIDSKAPHWKHGALRAAKKLQGLPSIAFLDAAGTVLTQVPAKQRSVAGFRQAGARATEYVRLRAGTAKGDQRCAARFLGLQLEERQVTLEAAIARRHALTDETLDANLLAALDRSILHLRIATEMRAKGQQRRHELGPRFYKLWKDGPKPGLDVSRGFWYAMLEWAEREKNAKIFSEALRGMREAVDHTDPGATWAPGMFARYEAKLTELRKGSGF